MKNKRIAVFANAWSNEFVKLLTEGICKEAERDNVDVFIFATYIYWGETEKQAGNKLALFDLANPSDYDGAIVFANTFNSAVEIKTVQDRFKDSDVPVITTEVKMPGMAYLGSSNYEGAYELAEHLVTMHSVNKVVYVSGIPGNGECAERRTAVSDALAKHGLTIMDSFSGEFAYRGAANAVNRYLDNGGEIPDAFICANDHMALGIMSELHKRGIEVPDDVIVTGFDYVYEAQTSFPLLATVSRRWNDMGMYSYNELKKLMDNPAPDLSIELRTRFVASESCGCRGDESSIRKRIDRIRNLYEIYNRSNGMDQFFQMMQFEVSKAESKEDFYNSAAGMFERNNFIGKDYCICTNPEFFSEEDEDYLGRNGKYSSRMDVLLELRDSRLCPQSEYESSELYPGYKKDPDSSEVYVFSPLSSREYNIGYIAVRNHPGVLYDLEFQKWTSNLSTILYTIRQYIFSQRTNHKLKEIYMSDSMTGMFNRTGCEEVLFTYIESEKQHGNTTMILFVDINRMKMINDEYGHLSGDLAIKAVSQAMKRSLTNRWLLGRFGGDEFIAVGEYPGDDFIELYRDKFDVTMKKMRERLKVNFPLSASVGFAVIPPDDKGTVGDYIRLADESMYEQKQKAHRELDAQMASE